MMKSIRSMPVMSNLESSKSALEAKNKKPGFSRSQSMIQPWERLRNVASSVPFMAIAGLSSHLRGITRSVSRRALSASYGSVSSTSIAKRDPSHPFLCEDTSLLPKLITDSQFTGAMIFAVFTAVMGAFQVGYNSGVLNVPEDVIKKALTLTEIQWSIAVAIFGIGGLQGAWAGGRIADNLGRRWFMILNNVLFISGGLMQAGAMNFWMLAIARLILGIGCGASTVVVPLYLGEIAPASLRGSLGTMNQFACVVAILVATLLGKPLGTPEYWRYLLGFVLVPAITQLILAPFLLESPLWLIVHQGGTKANQQASDILQKLRGHSDVAFDMECMIAAKPTQQDETTHENISIFKVMMSPGVRFPLMIGLVLQLAQQFSGINAVFYYSTSFFEKAHVSNPWIGSVLAAGVNVAATALALVLMDRAGRRTLLLVSAAGMMASCVGLTAGLILGLQTSAVWVGYVLILWVLAFVTFFEIGLGPIPWLIGAEIYPSHVRGTAMSISSGVNWIANSCVGLTFPHINNALQQYTFVPFGLILFIVVFFTWYYVPETRGKSLNQIQAELNGETDSDPFDEAFSEDEDFGDFENLSDDASASDDNTEPEGHVGNIQSASPKKVNGNHSLPRSGAPRTLDAFRK